MTSNDYDVLNLDTLNTNPYCVHGPTVLFSNKLKKFFSCSACRDHKLCNFYANYDGKSFSEDKLNKWKNIYLEFNANKSDFQEEYFQTFLLIKIICFVYVVYTNLFSLKKLKKLTSDKRVYCQTCNLFIFDSDKHLEHDTLSGISDEMLDKPIKYILEPLTSNSSNAVTFFV